MLTETGSIMDLKTANDSSIKWLNIGCEIWLEELHLNICWFIQNSVPQEVISHQKDVLTFRVHVKVKFL